MGRRRDAVCCVADSDEAVRDGVGGRLGARRNAQFGVDCWTCVCAVRGLMNSRAAISRFVRPSRSSRSTSTSRGVMPCAAASVVRPTSARARIRRDGPRLADRVRQGQGPPRRPRRGERLLSERRAGESRSLARTDRDIGERGRRSPRATPPPPRTAAPPAQPAQPARRQCPTR